MAEIIKAHKAITRLTNHNNGLHWLIKQGRITGRKYSSLKYGLWISTQLHTNLEFKQWKQFVSQIQSHQQSMRDL